MTMTKKDYEMFANEIHKYRKFDGTVIEVPAHIFNEWVEITVTVFAKDNPLFDEDKYRRACYEGKHIRKSIKS